MGAENTWILWFPSYPACFPPHPFCLHVTSWEGNTFSTWTREYPAIVWFEVSWPAQGELDHCSVYRERSQGSSMSNRTKIQWRTGFEVLLIQSHFHVRHNPFCTMQRTVPTAVDQSFALLFLLGGGDLWFESWPDGQQSSLRFLNSSKQCRENIWKYAILHNSLIRNIPKLDNCTEYSLRGEI
jgi:hypothetical protein